VTRSQAPPRRRPAGSPGPTNPIDPRLRVRRAEVARARMVRRRRRVLLVAAAITLGTALVGLVYRSPLLDIDQVTVYGTDRAEPTEVRRAAAVPLGQALASADLSAARRRVLAVPWVATARLRRSWPATVQVEVTERVPVAVVGESPSLSLVDRAGRVLGPGSATTQLPAIEGVSPPPGQRLDPPRRRLAGVLATLPGSLRPQVSAALVRGQSLTFTLTDGVTVRWGDAGQSATKAASLMALLTQAHRETIGTVDVSVPSAAALTRKDAPVA